MASKRDEKRNICRIEKVRIVSYLEEKRALDEHGNFAGEEQVRLAFTPFFLEVGMGEMGTQRGRDRERKWESKSVSWQAASRTPCTLTDHRVMRVFAGGRESL